MFGELSPSIVVCGLVIIAVAGVLLFRSQFSSEARLQRRRRKNYGPAISKAKGPSVKLAVKTESQKD